MRITTADLEGIVKRLNEVSNTPLTYGVRDSEGNFKANIGHYHISGAYGGVQLHQLMNEGGGVHVMSENGYTTKSDLYTQIQMLIKGIALK